MKGNGKGAGDKTEGGISCQEAAERVYEYLDGELDATSADEVREHVRVCQRCWPYYGFERLFLASLRSKGRRPEPARALKERIHQVLGRMGR